MINIYPSKIFRRFLLGIKVICVCVLYGREEPLYWIGADYLIWSIKDNPLSIPLLTSASYADSLPGAIGQPGTHVLMGNDNISMKWMNGFEVGAGARVHPCVEIEGSYYLLPSVSKRKSMSTSGEPGSQNVAVPIFDVSGVFGLGGVPGETVFILPGPLDGDPGFFGDFQLRLKSQLQGAQLNVLYSITERQRLILKGVGGISWFQLRESLAFKANSHAVSNFSFSPGFFNFSDRFSTLNNFLAAQIGIDGRYEQERWRLFGGINSALGALLEQIKIHGTSRTSGGNLFFATNGTAKEILAGGIFAEPTNNGTHKRTRFAYAFKGQLGASVKCTRNLEIDVGYTIFWLSRVLRPGKQIDRKINTTRTALADASRNTVGTGSGPIPFGSPAAAPAASGPKRPRARYNSSTFYAQGFNVGITLKF